MFFNLQVEHDQFLMYAPWIEQIPVKVLIDHAGRPDPAAGLNQPAFAAMKMAEAKGLVGVNLAVAAESMYFGAKKPLRHLDDFKGMAFVKASPIRPWAAARSA